MSIKLCRDHLSAANQDQDFKRRCEKDGADGAAHSYPFVQLMPIGGDFLACVADMGVLGVDSLQDLDVGWNVEEIKHETYQLVGNRPVGIC